MIQEPHTKDIEPVFCECAGLVKAADIDLPFNFGVRVSWMSASLKLITMSWLMISLLITSKMTCRRIVWTRLSRVTGGQTITNCTRSLLKSCAVSVYVTNDIVAAKVGSDTASARLHHSHACHGTHAHPLPFNSFPFSIHAISFHTMHLDPLGMCNSLPVFLFSFLIMFKHKLFALREADGRKETLIVRVRWVWGHARSTYAA